MPRTSFTLRYNLDVNGQQSTHSWKPQIDSTTEYKFLLGDVALGLTFMLIVAFSIYMAQPTITTGLEIKDYSGLAIALAMFIFLIAVPLGLAISEISLMIFSLPIYEISRKVFGEMCRRENLCMAFVRNRLLCKFLNRNKRKTFFGNLDDASNDDEYLFDYLNLLQRYLKDRNICGFTAKNVSRASGMRVYFRGIALSSLIGMTIIIGINHQGLPAGLPLLVLAILLVSTAAGRRVLILAFFMSRWYGFIAAVLTIIIAGYFLNISMSLAALVMLFGLLIVSIVASAFADLYTRIHILKGFLAEYQATRRQPDCPVYRIKRNI